MKYIQLCTVLGGWVGLCLSRERVCMVGAFFLFIGVTLGVFACCARLFLTRIVCACCMCPLSYLQVDLLRKVTQYAAPYYEVK